MKTDDRATRQRDEVEGDEAKVVRLSDWLGPDEELVPFGPRAHAATRELAAGSAGPDTGAAPPGASGFWDGDPSVHTAVPGPGIFDEPGEPTADRDRRRRAVPVWRPALPTLHPFGWGSRVRERLADLDLDRISWRWAAAGAAFVALALVVLVITSGGVSSGHRDAAAQAGIGESARPGLSGTLDDIGTATRAAAVSDLRRLPRVNTAGRTIGTAALHARVLQARHRYHPVVVPAPLPSSSATGSVETPTTTSSPAEATSAPSETEPTQTTSSSSPSPTSGGGGATSGGGTSGGDRSSSSQQSAFGPGGSLGPGSSPNG